MSYDSEPRIRGMMTRPRIRNLLDQQTQREGVMRDKITAALGEPPAATNVPLEGMLDDLIAAYNKLRGLHTEVASKFTTQKTARPDMLSIWVGGEVLGMLKFDEGAWRVSSVHDENIMRLGVATLRGVESCTQEFRAALPTPEGAEVSRPRYQQKPQSAERSNPRDVAAERKCLNCGRAFDSSGIGNRLCRDCGRRAAAG